MKNTIHNTIQIDKEHTAHFHHHHENDKMHVDHKYKQDLHGVKTLCIRPQSGLSGDMLLCGLASLLQIIDEELNYIVKSVGLEVLDNVVKIAPRFVHGIQGMSAVVNLPHEHCHRTNAEIQSIIEKSSLTEKAKQYAKDTFNLLAKAEATVHGKKMEEVCFHEVGALDSILDICVVCALFDKLQIENFICGALPLADGIIQCAHGLIPSPAPAVLQLLENVPVCAFTGKGETITPTAIALLKALKADFGLWPSMKIEKSILVYGSKVFENAPNGSIFALGQAL